MAVAIADTEAATFKAFNFDGIFGLAMMIEKQER
jgi:hypothetical protein